MRALFPFAIFFVSLSARAATVPEPFALSFRDHGKAIKAMTSAEIAKATPPVDVTTFEFLENGERSYKAVAFSDLLTKVYGEAWKNAEEVLFTCADGYQPSVPVAKVREFPAYLAFARNDQAEFSLV